MSVLSSTTTLFVDDQQRALEFYTTHFDYAVHQHVPMGEVAWITLVMPGVGPGFTLSLEPSDHEHVRALRASLVEEGIPFFSIGVADAAAEVERLRGEGVTIVQEATDLGPVVVAVIDDGVGNLVQVASMTEQSAG